MSETVPFFRTPTGAQRMKKREPIENTEQTVASDPRMGLLYGTQEGIRATERAGQRQFVESEVLPTNTKQPGDAPFLALGFTFGEPVSGDPLFRAATLPAGWKREGSDHAMWSHIVDERGIKRVAVFYKAAFYDRDAFMRLTNVGADLATTALYGDAPVTAAMLRLDVLTTDERAAARRTVEQMRAGLAESPHIYGKYAPRVDECVALLGIP